MFKKFFIALLLCASAQHVFSATPNPAASDKGEVILSIDGKPALYASELEQKLLETSVIADLVSEQRIELFLKDAIQDKLKETWAAKEKIVERPEFKRILNKRIEEAKNEAYGQYFLSTKMSTPTLAASEAAIEQLQKDLHIVIYPDRIESQNENNILVTADSKPALTLKQFNEYLDADWTSPFGPPDTGMKKSLLDHWASMKAFELWSEKNNIQLPVEFHKKLNAVKESQKLNLIRRFFAEYFKLRLGDNFFEKHDAAIKKLKQDFNVKENTEYLERFKKYVNTTLKPIDENFSKKARSGDMIDWDTFAQQLKDAIRDFFHPKKVSEVKK